MKRSKTTRTFLTALAAITFVGSADAALIGFQAESGTIPFSTVAFDGWRLETDANALGGQAIWSEAEDFSSPTLPGEEDHIASYDVTFSTAGTYDVYARLMRPSTATSADSLFYDKTFGAPDSWQQINNLSASGAPLATVDVYVWVNLSDYGNNTYTVASPGTLQFNIASRERRLRIDAFAFGTSTDTFTDAQLTAAVPEPGSLALLTLGGLLIARRRRA